MSSNILSLFTNNYNAKRVAAFLIIGYVTYKLWKSFASNNKSLKPSSDTNTTSTASDKNNTIQPIEESKGIPVSETSILIQSAGTQEINGEYRWFLNSGSWCFFNETNSKGYSLKANVRIDERDTRFKKFKKFTDKQAKYCMIGDIEGNVIYYAAPQKHVDYIPNDSTQWIAVQGMGASPSLYVNLMDAAKEPNEEEQFGNVKVAKKESEVVHKMAMVNEEADEEEDDDLSDLETNEKGNGVREEEEEDDEESDMSDLGA